MLSEMYVLHCVLYILYIRKHLFYTYVNKSSNKGKIIEKCPIHQIFLEFQVCLKFYILLWADPSQADPNMDPCHTGLTRVSSIQFLIFEIKRVLVYNSIIIYFTDLFMLYIFIQNAYVNKKVLKKKGEQIMFNGSNCDRKSQFPGILTEPLSPRDVLGGNPFSLKQEKDV